MKSIIGNLFLGVWWFVIKVYQPENTPDKRGGKPIINILKIRYYRILYRVTRIANVSCPPVHFPIPFFSHPQISSSPLFHRNQDFTSDPDFPEFWDFTKFDKKNHPRFPRNKKTTPEFRPRFSRNKMHPIFRPPNLWPFHHVFSRFPPRPRFWPSETEKHEKVAKFARFFPILPDFWAEKVIMIPKNWGWLMSPPGGKQGRLGLSLFLRGGDLISLW